MSVPADCREAAHAFLAAGLQPVAIVTMAEAAATGKVPKQPPFSWRAMQTSRATARTIDGWYVGPHAGRGVGIICGAISGDLVAIDADVSGDQPGWPLLEAAIAAVGGELADGWTRAKAGWMDETPTGGRHVLIRVPSAEIGNVKLAGPPRGKAYVETRGEGGLVVCPPSGGDVHPSGLAYRMLAGGPDTIVTLSPAWWDAFVAACQTFDEQPEHGLQTPPRGPSWTGAGLDTRPGADFNRRARWDELLPRYGFTVTTRRGDRLRFRRPGRADGESGTVFLNAGAGGVLKMWSTSVAELEGGGNYNPFAFYAAMEHGGDFAAAARVLAAEGYGEGQSGPVLTIGAHRLTSAAGPREDGPAMEDGNAALRPDLEPAAPASPPDNVRTLTGTPLPPDDGNDTVTVTVAVDGRPVRVRLTDAGNAERLANRVRDRFAWVGQHNAWYRFDGRRWRESTKREIFAEAKQDAIELHPLAARIPNDDLRKALRKHATASEGARRIEAAVSLSRSEPGIAFDDAELDADAMLLNVANGTLDLRTGELRPHRPGDRITKLAPVDFDPAATAPTWQAFLDRVLPDPDVQAFVQAFFGYAMTGHTTHILPIAHGRGANGKSTMVDAVMTLMGDYAIQSPIETFMQDKHSSGTGPTPELARLQGARLVFTSEGGAGQRLNVGRLKLVTGGEKIPARRLYANATEFTPTHMMWVSTNHLPIVPGDDPALWRRVRLVPFDVTIPESEQDPRLKDKLLAEGSGILNWLLEGLAAVKDTGKIPTPTAVAQATQTYRSDNDEVGEFIAQRCIEEPRTRDTTKNLYEAYRAWIAETMGESAEPMKQKAFGSNLKQRGYDQARDGSNRYWLGLRLRRPGDPPVDDASDGLVTHVTDVTLVPGNPLLDSPIGTFRENPSHVSHASQDPDDASFDGDEDGPTMHGDGRGVGNVRAF